MKLAEALSIRADLQKKVAQLKERIKESAKVQEGDEPCGNLEELYKELDEAVVQLEDLIYRINITNVQIVQDGDSLTGENGAFPPTRNGCIHSLSMRERG